MTLILFFLVFIDDFAFYGFILFVRLFVISRIFSCLLASGSALGKVYNISNGAPVPLWDVVNYVMRQMQVPQVTRYRSYGLAYSVATLNEGFCKLWPGRPEPTLSRLGMQVMNKNFTLDISRARHYLDYDPKVSLWAALDEFCGWWKAQDIGASPRH